MHVHNLLELYSHLEGFAIRRYNCGACIPLGNECFHIGTSVFFVSVKILCYVSTLESDVAFILVWLLDGEQTVHSFSVLASISVNGDYNVWLL